MENAAACWRSQAEAGADRAVGVQQWQVAGAVAEALGALGIVACAAAECPVGPETRLRCIGLSS
jgi:hypothetical protein